MYFANIIFFSSLISVFVSNNYLYIPIYGETNFTAQTFCGLLITFAKSLNIIIYPVLELFSLYRLGEVNKAMGNSGICYLLCAYISLILQFFSTKKVDDKLKNFVDECSLDFSGKYETRTEKANINNIINYVYSNNDILKEIEKRIRRKIKWEKIKALTICDEDRYKILNIKNGKNINLTIKKLDRTKYNININDADKIIGIKYKIKQLDEMYRKNIIVLVWKGKVIEDFEYISSYGIKDGDLIVLLIRKVINKS